MKYSISIDKLDNPNLVKFLKGKNSYTSSLVNGKLGKIWDCFTLVIFNYLIHFKKLRK